MDPPLETHRPPREPPVANPTVLPSFVLIAPPRSTNLPSLCDAWKSALADLPPAIAAKFSVKETRLDPPTLAQEFGTFDCVVSPANAFGIMDGG